MLGIFNCRILQACRVFCWTRHVYKHSVFPAWCLQRNANHTGNGNHMITVCYLVWLAFPINAHQNANQKPTGSAPAYQAQCTLPPQPIYPTLLFDFSRVWFTLTMMLSINIKKKLVGAVSPQWCNLFGKVVMFTPVIPTYTAPHLQHGSFSATGLMLVCGRRPLKNSNWRPILYQLQ